MTKLLMALALATLLGGCVAYPAYPGYAYYGGGPAYGGGWHEHGWHGGGYYYR